LQNVFINTFCDMGGTVPRRGMEGKKWRKREGGREGGRERERGIKALPQTVWRAASTPSQSNSISQNVFLNKF